MHAREMIELAFLIASNGESIVHDPAGFAPHNLHRYWITSRCRLDRWSRTLKQPITTGQSDSDDGQVAYWQAARVEIEEILISEALTRTWTAAGVIHDRLRSTKEVEPILRGVFVGHLEARNRALNLMVYGHGFSAKESVELNSLRRRMERLTDFLLARLDVHSDVAEFGFDSRRINQFKAECDRESSHGDETMLGNLETLDAGKSVALDSRARTLNGDLNQQIAAAVLSCLPDDLFDSLGQFNPLWLLRLAQNTSDAQDMIADLLAIDAPLTEISCR